ncbi:MAG: flagellar protein FliS [Alphaproteobacteria bacterium]
MQSLFYAAPAAHTRPSMPHGAPALDVLLLDGAITSMGTAIEAIELGDDVACSDAVLLANAIMSQLYLGLDKRERPMTTESLAQIYNFVLRRLPRVNVREGAGSARQIRTILEPLRDTWLNLHQSLTTEIAAASLHATR